MDVFKLIEKHGIELHGEIEYFAELVRADEREACAKVCDGIMQYYKTNTTMNTDQNLIGYMSAELCGVRIRGRND